MNITVSTMVANHKTVMNHAIALHTAVAAGELTLK